MRISSYYGVTLMILATIGLTVWVLALWSTAIKSGVSPHEQIKQIERVYRITKPYESRLPQQLDVNPYYLAVPQCAAGNELLWLACGVYFEARNQTVRGQHLVAHVILNRVHDRRWPKTIEAVVRQGEKVRDGCQFSFMCDGKPEHITEYGAWLQALRVAQWALNDVQAGHSVTCAHSYHANYVTSKRALRWFATLQREQAEDVHIFYCDPGVNV